MKKCNIKQLLPEEGYKYEGMFLRMGNERVVGDY